LLLHSDEIELAEAAVLSLGENQDQSQSAVGRRTFLIGTGAAAIGLVWLHFQNREAVGAEAPSAELPRMVTIAEFTDAGERKSTVTIARIVKTEDQWRKQLSADSFEVTRRAGTERPFTGENLNVYEKGVFRCICCGTALFSFETKFESGTGWPSFWAPIAKENTLETGDSSWGIVRTAVSCRLCDAHLGHVFHDGPPPTGLRYCMNSVALRFAQAT
jgi:peptide-methionine (R)-S-oxide reductase